MSSPFPNPPSNKVAGSGVWRSFGADTAAVERVPLPSDPVVPSTPGTREGVVADRQFTYKVSTRTVASVAQLYSSLTFCRAFCSTVLYPVQMYRARPVL